MRRNSAFKSILVVTVVVLVGFGASAFAGMYGKGQGMGLGQGQGRGYGQGMGWEGCPGYRNLTAEQRKAVDTERDAFRDATADLRRQRQQKSLELHSVLLGKPVDAEKAKSVQGEISALDAQLDQLWIDHVIKMKSIDPDFASGPMMGLGKMGPGRHLMAGGHGFHRGHGNGPFCGR